MLFEFSLSLHRQTESQFVRTQSRGNRGKHGKESGVLSARQILAAFPARLIGKSLWRAKTDL